MLTLSLMGTRHFRTDCFAADFVRLRRRGTRIQAAPRRFIWSPEAPFAQSKPKVEIPPTPPCQSLSSRASCCSARANSSGALKEFEAAAQANPGDSFLHFRLATLYLRKGDLKKAVAEAETAVRLDPKSVDNHLLLAGLYSSLGENQKGLAEYTEVLKLDPKNQEAMLYLGALYLQLEDYARATKSRRAAEARPSSALGHYYLGRVRAKSKLYLAAEQSYRKALELNPKSEAVLMDLALVYELEGKTEEAIQTYQRLLQVNPQNVWARNRLGELYVGQNKLDEALSQFEEAWKARKPIRAKLGSRSV